LKDLEGALHAEAARLAEAEAAVAEIDALRVERRRLLVDERLGADVSSRLAEIEREIEVRPARRDDLAGVVAELKARCADRAEADARPLVEEAEAKVGRVRGDLEAAEARVEQLRLDEVDAVKALNAARGDLARARAAFDLDARREIERAERRRRKRVERLARHGDRQLDSPVGGERVATMLERAERESPGIRAEVEEYRRQEGVRLAELRRVERERRRQEAAQSWERAGVAPPP
jgi:hypothetical protein